MEFFNGKIDITLLMSVWCQLHFGRFKIYPYSCNNN